MEQQNPLQKQKISPIFFIDNINFDPAFSGLKGKEFFLKYFPKHLRSFTVTFYHDGHFHTRLKHLKLIKNLSWTPSNKSFDSSFLRLTIANKRKTIKYYERYGFEGQDWHSKSTLQETKLLPNLTKFELFTPRKTDIDEEESWLRQTSYMKKTCCFLQHTNHLKHLFLYPVDEGLFPSFAKVNSFEKTLTRLETLEMEFYWPSNRDHLLFQSLLAYKKILKYLTRLSLGTLYGKNFLNVLNVLLNLCPLLSYLAFTASPELISHNPPTPRKPQEDVGDLNCLQNLTNLKELRLVISSSLKFIEHFKFPKSLVKISLYFAYIDWEPYMVEKDPQNSPFKGLFEELINLKSIEITLQQAQPQENQEARGQTQKEFLRSLICGIPIEAHLILTLTHGNWATNFVKYLGSLDLRISWEYKLSTY